MPHAVRFGIVLVLSFVSCGSVAAQPAYSIMEIGVASGDTNSSAAFISRNGIATGLSFPGLSSSRAFQWTEFGGTSGLPNLASPALPFGRGWGANAAGVIVGQGGLSFSGASPLPLIWQNGVVSQLPLPSGQTLGRAYAINDSNVAVGSVGSSTEVGVTFANGSATIITQLTSNASYLQTALAINNAGRIVGYGVNPANLAVTVGYVLDSGANTAFSVGALPGQNGAICYGVNAAGQIVGTSTSNQANNLPFIYSDATGILPIPLAPGTTNGSANAINSDGWVVGVDQAGTSIPFLFDGTTTYRLGDLIPANSGWDLLNNSTANASGISDGGIIVGTGLFHGEVRAFAMIPVPEPGSAALVLTAIGLAGVRRWRVRPANRLTCVTIPTA